MSPRVSPQVALTRASPRVTPSKAPVKAPPTPTNQQTTEIKPEAMEETEAEVETEVYPVQGEVNHDKFMPVSEFTPDYVSLLQKLQDRISNPREGDNLESIVKLVQKTECYAIDSDSVKFDLCLLDKRTVIKITKELGISVK